MRIRRLLIQIVYWIATLTFGVLVSPTPMARAQSAGVSSAASRTDVMANAQRIILGRE